MSSLPQKNVNSILKYYNVNNPSDASNFNLSKYNGSVSTNLSTFSSNDIAVASASLSMGFMCNGAYWNNSPSNMITSINIDFSNTAPNSTLFVFAVFSGANVSQVNISDSTGLQWNQRGTLTYITYNSNGQPVTNYNNTIEFYTPLSSPISTVISLSWNTPANVAAYAIALTGLSSQLFATAQPTQVISGNSITIPIAYNPVIVLTAGNSNTVPVYATSPIPGSGLGYTLVGSMSSFASSATIDYNNSSPIIGDAFYINLNVFSISDTLNNNWTPLPIYYVVNNNGGLSEIDIFENFYTTISNPITFDTVTLTCINGNSSVAYASNLSYSSNFFQTYFGVLQVSLITWAVSGTNISNPIDTFYQSYAIPSPANLISITPRNNNELIPVISITSFPNIIGSASNPFIRMKQDYTNKMAIDYTTLTNKTTINFSVPNNNYNLVVVDFGLIGNSTPPKIEFSSVNSTVPFEVAPPAIEYSAGIGIPPLSLTVDTLYSFPGQLVIISGQFSDGNPIKITDTNNNTWVNRWNTDWTKPFIIYSNITNTNTPDTITIVTHSGVYGSIIITINSATGFNIPSPLYINTSNILSATLNTQASYLISYSNPNSSVNNFNILSPIGNSLLYSYESYFGTGLSIQYNLNTTTNNITNTSFSFIIIDSIDVSGNYIFVNTTNFNLGTDTTSIIAPQNLDTTFNLYVSAINGFDGPVYISYTVTPIGGTANPWEGTVTFNVPPPQSPPLYYTVSVNPQNTPPTIYSSLTQPINPLISNNNILSPSMYQILLKGYYFHNDGITVEVSPSPALITVIVQQSISYSIGMTFTLPTGLTINDITNNLSNYPNSAKLTNEQYIINGGTIPFSYQKNIFLTNDGIFYLFFLSGPNGTLSFATSPDGITWTPTLNPPLIDGTNPIIVNPSNKVKESDMCLVSINYSKTLNRFYVVWVPNESSNLYLSYFVPSGNTATKITSLISSYSISSTATETVVSDVNETGDVWISIVDDIASSPFIYYYNNLANTITQITQTITGVNNSFYFIILAHLYDSNNILHELAITSPRPETWKNTGSTTLNIIDITSAIFNINPVTPQTITLTTAGIDLRISSISIDTINNIIYLLIVSPAAEGSPYIATLYEYTLGSLVSKYNFATPTDFIYGSAILIDNASRIIAIGIRNQTDIVAYVSTDGGNTFSNSITLDYDESVVSAGDILNGSLSSFNSFTYLFASSVYDGVQSSYFHGQTISLSNPFNSPITKLNTSDIFTPIRGPQTIGNADGYISLTNVSSLVPSVNYIFPDEGIAFSGVTYQSSSPISILTSGWYNGPFVMGDLPPTIRFSLYPTSSRPTNNELIIAISSTPELIQAITNYLTAFEFDNPSTPSSLIVLEGTNGNISTLPNILYSTSTTIILSVDNILSNSNLPSSGNIYIDFNYSQLKTSFANYTALSTPIHYFGMHVIGIGSFNKLYLIPSASGGIFANPINSVVPPQTPVSFNLSINPTTEAQILRLSSSSLIVNDLILLDWENSIYDANTNVQYALSTRVNTIDISDYPNISTITPVNFLNLNPGESTSLVLSLYPIDSDIISIPLPQFPSLSISSQSSYNSNLGVKIVPSGFSGANLASRDNPLLSLVNITSYIPNLNNSLQIGFGGNFFIKFIAKDSQPANGGFGTAYIGVSIGNVPSITLSPSSGTHGTSSFTINISGAGFQPNATISSIIFDNVSNITISPSTITVDNKGTFSASIQLNLPNNYPTTVLVTVEDSTGNVADASFDIL